MRRVRIGDLDSEDLSVHTVHNSPYTSIQENSETPSPLHSRNSSIIHITDSVVRNLYIQPKATTLCKDRLDRMLSSYLYNIICVLFILFSLFGDQLRLATCPASSDDVFAECFAGLMGFFALDIALQCTARQGYFNSFPFWLDLFATFSLFVDISWVWSIILDRDNYEEKIARSTGSASRIAARSSQVIRIVRLFRLLRVMKMYNSTKKLMMVETSKRCKTNRPLNSQRKRGTSRNSSDLNKYISDRNSIRGSGTTLERFTQSTFARLYQAKQVPSIKIDQPPLELPIESNMSKSITDRTVRQVFFLVFCSAILFPFLQIEVYLSVPTSYEYGLSLLEDFRGTELFEVLWKDYIDEHTNSANLATLLYIADINANLTWQQGTDYPSLRPEEILEIESTHFSAIYDQRAQTRILAYMDIGEVVFLSSLMLISAIKVIYDFSTTVIFGLERMITYVKKIARDPMLLLKSEQPMSRGVSVQQCCCFRRDVCEYSAYEISLLEQAVNKIGVMFALSFGSAGCEIITQNMKTGGTLNPLIPGKMVFAAFGFISIANFEKLELILHQDIVLYVNKISKLVHCVCENYQGAVNRNLGDHFLVVWKFKQDDHIRTGSRLSLHSHSQSVQQRAAFALLSAVKTLCKLVRSAEMLEYQQNTNIAREIPFFTNKLTVGLHVGWAVEGPVGSEFKIDAAYISPALNIVASLESATKLYGVHILASESFVTLLDDQIQPYLRHVDTVVLKGTEPAMNIYSFDLNLGGLGVSKHKSSKAKVDAKRLKVQEAFEFDYFQVHLLFTQSQKIRKMREMYDESFLESYHQALGRYLEGRWSEAADILQTKCMRMLPMDGPSSALMTFMESKEFVCPPDWAGVRVLGSK